LKRIGATLISLTVSTSLALFAGLPAASAATLFSPAASGAAMNAAPGLGTGLGGGANDKDKAAKHDKANKTVGHVTQTNAASIDQTELTVGTTLYNGDTVDTAESGSMHAGVHSSQLELDPSSSATLEECTDELHVLVNYGTVNFNAAAADKVEFIIAQGIVRPLDGGSASGRISLVSSREAVVSATQGSLDIDDDGKHTTIPEGKTYKITLGGDPRDYAPAPGCGAGYLDNAKMIHPVTRNLTFSLILLGLAGGGGYLLWQHSAESPSKP
jgi:hypothetical protein